MDKFRRHCSFLFLPRRPASSLRRTSLLLWLHYSGTLGADWACVVVDGGDDDDDAAAVDCGGYCCCCGDDSAAAVDLS